MDSFTFFDRPGSTFQAAFSFSSTVEISGYFCSRHRDPGACAMAMGYCFIQATAPPPDGHESPDGTEFCFGRDFFFTSFSQRPARFIPGLLPEDGSADRQDTGLPGPGDRPAENSRRLSDGPFAH